jgi:hypothetical protein
LGLLILKLGVSLVVRVRPLLLVIIFLYEILRSGYEVEMVTLLIYYPIKGLNMKLLLVNSFNTILPTFGNVHYDFPLHDMKEGFSLTVFLYNILTRSLMKNNLKTYTTTAIIAVALASMLMLVPSNTLAAKQTTSGVHFQGPAPRLTLNGDTATSTPFTLAGLGQGSGTATLTVTGTFDVQCRNPGGNIAPGQDTSATGTSGSFGFTSQNGKASIPSLTATLDPSTANTANSCPNSSWTPIVGEGAVTSATLTVAFNGQTIFTTSR